MNVLIITSAKVNSNSENLLTAFTNILDNNEESYKIFHTDLVNRACIGCKKCTACCINDDFTKEIINKPVRYDCIVFAGAVYFFDLNSDLRKALERLYCYTLKDVPIGLILTSGSNFRYGGVDLIIEQFKRIDEYCGTRTVTPFNKVTYDLRTPINETDIKGLQKLYEDLRFEVTLNEA